MTTGDNQDIAGLYDTNAPTLYYMFGKACSGKDFVLSDRDLLRFTKSWLLPLDSGNKAKPKNLSMTLANKYLLVLGNNWQEWFFRFFWYALKDEYLLDRNGQKIGMETLEKAINNYRGIKVEEDEHDEGAIICKCFGITDTKIKRAIRENNLTTVDEITFYTKAGGGCGACKVKLEDILNEELAERERAQKNAPLTTVQKIKKIEEAIETVINPMLKMDGGSCKLVDIEGNIVKISFKGACSSCMASKNTLKGFVEPKIKELVDKDLEVVGV